MPGGLDRAELREPRTKEAKWLIDRLQIQRLSPATALDRLLSAIATKRFPSTDAECADALELVWAVWKLDPRLVTARAQQLRRLPVPARTSMAKKAWSWQPAGDIYFGRLWGLPDTEHLYGHLRQPEFLADPPPRGARARRMRQQFFEALGVAPVSRLVDYEHYAKRHPLATTEWRHSDEIAPAWVCPDGHLYSGRDVECPVMDRLDPVLQRAAEHPATAAALAAVVAELQVPYGPQAKVTCTNSSHYGRRGTTKSATGYQRWRLQQARWVPVSGSPDGASLGVPTQAWWNIPRSAPWLLVARSRLTSMQAERLELVAADHPTPQAIAAALAKLRDAHPNLGVAPMEVHRTAEWLTRRLDLVLRGGQGQRTQRLPYQRLVRKGPSGRLLR